MMKNFLLLLLPALIAMLPLHAQKSQLLLDHYGNEYRTFKESIKNEQAVKGDTNIDVRFYYIDIAIAVDSTYISGAVTILFEPVIPDLSQISISLNSALTVGSVSSPATSFYQDNDEIIITLDTGYDPGEPVELTIEYSGVPVKAGGYKGLRYEKHGDEEPVIATLSTPYLAHYWYPCKDGPADKPDSVYMDITIPDTLINGIPMMGISNGMLENIIDNGDTRTFQWRHRYPIVPYYVMAAVSNYVTFQDTFNGAWGESFPLDYYVFQEDLTSSQTGVVQIPEAIQFFSSIFGPYPFSSEKYGMTQLGFYGAIENQTNTIQNSLSSSWIIISVHELSHMWFGDMITLESWHHSWLNEGFATYAEALWIEHKSGFEAYKQNMATNEFWAGGTLYLENAADTFNTFQPIFYSKGAYAVHMLRGILGDELFFSALFDYAQDPAFMYGHASTEDLRESFETTAGMDLFFFFDQWIYDAYYPVYLYNYSQDEANQLHVVIPQAQEELYGYRPVFEMPVRMKVSFIGGTDTTLTFWNDEQTQYFTAALGQEITSAEFDPDRWILRVAEYDPDIPVSTEEIHYDRQISVFPNPSSGGFTIKPDIPGAAFIELNITDLHGHKIAGLYSGGYLPSMKVTWDGCTISRERAEPGIYLVEARTDKGVETMKILLR